MKKKGLWPPDGGAPFLPFAIPARGVCAIADTPISVAPTAVELRLRNGRSLHFDSSMAGEALTQLIRAVEAV